MEKKQSMKKKRSRVFALLGILTALVLSCTVLQGEPEEMHAACTQNCGTCGGSGYTTSYYSNRSGTYVGGTNSGFVSGYSYGSYTIMRGCTTCGGSSDRTTYWKNSNCTGESISIGNATKGSGKVSKACTWPGSYSYASGTDDVSGKTYSDGIRYKNCTKCGARLETAYKVVLEKGTGIASVTGAGYSNAGTRIQVSCTVSTGYTFSKWSDGDTRQSWTSGNDLHCPRYYKATATANSYTQTMNHYLYNPDTAKWDYWKATMASEKYDSTFTPSYTTTPTGYYNHSVSHPNGWKVTGAGTFSVYYYPNTYTVTYDANGGTGAPAVANFLYNSTFSISTTVPTRAGYTFVNWYVVENGQYLVPGQARPKTWGSFTLKAQWKANNYDLTISPNGGTFADNTTETVTADPKLTYNAASWWNVGGYVPKRTGYTFQGFYDALEGGTKVYDETGACVTGTSYWTSDKKYCHAGKLAVYARWKENEYTVTYDTNGGTTETSTKTFYYGDEVDLTPTAQKDGKIFVGWSTEPDANAALHTLVMPDLATSENAEHADWELTLYAVYSIAVSDVANHTYPTYDETKGKKQEVFLRVYDADDLENYREYELIYTQDTNTMVYRYVLDVDISDFAGDMEKYYYVVYAYDNAGNWSIIHGDWVYRVDEPEPPDPPAPPKPEDPTIKKYLQTVEHYRYDAIEKKYKKCFSDTRTEVEENTLFTPSHLTPPTGYSKAHIEYPEGYEEAGKIIDGSYVATEDVVSKVYYEPNSYTITFDANGGSMNVNDATVAKTSGKLTFGDRYGNVSFGTSSGFLTPERKGYTFEGWYTKVDGGDMVESSEVYQTAANTTLYAHWSINQYTVTYDYWTNKGTSASVYQKSYDYQTAVDLSASAQKSDTNLTGWEHIGWNTDADATTGLSKFIIQDADVVLYAIYQKDISVTQIEQTNSGAKTSVQTKRIYNKADTAEFILELAAENTWTGWEHLGWTTETGAEEIPLVGAGGTYRISENTTVYSVYQSDVTLSHDTNGSTMLYEPQTKKCYYNAAGNGSYPFFTVADAPMLSRHSFVRWDIIAGMVIDADANQPTFCMPADAIQFKKDVILQAVWDKYPLIEAYSRHFTLEQARNGEITESELLKKVRATDEEAKSSTNPDGVLINDVDVIVKNYNALDFTNLTGNNETYVTYQATDSFGNISTKTVVVSITDTTTKKSTKKKYVRFISSRFFMDETENLITSEKGGLEQGSIWRTNIYYQELLKETVLNESINRLEKETWVFHQKEIKELKRYTQIYGRVRNALEEFFQMFAECKLR